MSYIPVEKFDMPEQVYKVKRIEEGKDPVIVKELRTCGWFNAKKLFTAYIPKEIDYKYKYIPGTKLLDTYHIGPYTYTIRKYKPIPKKHRKNKVGRWKRKLDKVHKPLFEPFGKIKSKHDYSTE